MNRIKAFAPEGSGLVTRYNVAAPARSIRMFLAQGRFFIAVDMNKDFELLSADETINYDRAAVAELPERERIAFHQRRISALTPAFELFDRIANCSGYLPRESVMKRLEILWALIEITEREMERRESEEVADTPEEVPRPCAIVQCSNSALSRIPFCNCCLMSQAMRAAINSPKIASNLNREAFGQ